MAQHLDLEEQEQLDQFKHFWKQYGNSITWLLIVVFGGVAAWNGWGHWQRYQSAQAAVLSDAVDTAAATGDVPALERAMSDIKDKFGGTTQAQQSVLLGAKVLYEKGKPDAARDALQWVADKTDDDGYRAIARLRLAGVLFEAKKYDEALAQLAQRMPPSFEPLAADRRGDVLIAQGKKDEARAEYQKAWDGLGGGQPLAYRQLVEVKLNALGVDTRAAAPAKTGEK